MLILPETNIAPKNGWLEYNCPIRISAYFQVLLWVLVSGTRYTFVAFFPSDQVDPR